MQLNKKLEKTRTDLENLKIREKKIKEKIRQKKQEEKKILDELAEEERKRKSQHDKRIAEIVTDTFGEVQEEDFGIFKDVMEKNSRSFLQMRRGLNE